MAANRMASLPKFAQGHVMLNLESDNSSLILKTANIPQ